MTKLTGRIVHLLLLLHEAHLIWSFSTSSGHPFSAARLGKATGLGSAGQIPVSVIGDQTQTTTTKPSTQKSKDIKLNRRRQRSALFAEGTSDLVLPMNATDGLFDYQDVDISTLVKSVNYFISRKCNYHCKFCFHTQKTSHHLQLGQAKLGLQLLKEAGTEKINFAGGEPFLHPQLLGELCKTSSQELGFAVSIISNGSMITPEWMKQYGRYVDVLGVSVDSFDDDTNMKIGRGERGVVERNLANRHVDRMLKVRELCQQHGLIFKLNTVVCSLNWEEDMNEVIRQLDPQRWKVFQVLLLEDENMGRPGTLLDARPLAITDQQFDAFVQRHNTCPQLIPEPNSVMQNSYLLLDENMAFLDCRNGGKVPTESILNVGVHKALDQAGFDYSMFQKRGGVYDWKRKRNNEE